VRYGGGAGAGSAKDCRHAVAEAWRRDEGKTEHDGDEGREEAWARGEVAGEELGVGL
jgi:hypothetical protein